MLEAGSGLDLGEEALREQRGRERGVEHFQGDPALVLKVVRRIHRGHSAATKLRFNPVAVCESLFQLRWCVDHAEESWCGKGVPS